MATIKSYTDLEQSKKLAEILPLESADMHLTNSSIKGEMYVEQCKPVLVPYLRAKDSLDAYSKIVNNMIAWEVIPSWSLAALLGVLPVMIDYKGSLIRLRIDKGHVGQDEYAIWYDDLDNGLSTNIASESKNPVDACYEMIIKLHELKML